MIGCILHDWCKIYSAIKLEKKFQFVYGIEIKDLP